tara:strand:+ start:76 stop:435 length:360 start_codon:yes stop_codon:yes gene_type:complete
METKIRLKNIQLFGCHGISDKEKNNEQKFDIDIEVSIDLKGDIGADDINKTVDYSSIYDKVEGIFYEKKYNLIETLANRIASCLISNFSVVYCKVIVRKPDAPINGIIDTVEVEIMQYA